MDMNTNSIRPDTAAPSAGVYESAGTQQENSFKVPLDEHLDAVTRGALRQAAQPNRASSMSSIIGMARRNPIPMLLVLGGLAWLVASLSRKSIRRWG